MAVVNVPRTNRGTGESLARGVPNPRIQLPLVASPTVLLFLGALLVWAGATWLVLADAAPLWVTIPAHTLVSFTMFTVLHESAHHSAGRFTLVNEVLGRLSMLFVAAYGSFPMLRFIHLEHHRNTNEDSRTDPDAWTSQGSWWSLPFRWLTIDAWYVRFYNARVTTRPPAEQLETFAVLLTALAGFGGLIATGWGWELLVIYLIPQRAGLALLAWWFDWLPHHGLGATRRQDRFGLARVRVGLEWLMTPLMLYQNYHLVHHLHPALPFYRYLRAWNTNREAYLAHNVPITTAWGRDLSAEEYRQWRQLAGSLADTAEQPIEPSSLDFFPLTVSEVRHLSADTVAVSFAVPEDLREVFEGRPGQHVTIQATVEGLRVQRTYALCAGPGLRVAIKHVGGGVFSTYANTALRAGDTLEVQPPSGAFVLGSPARRAPRYVAVAAGIGIAPVLPVVADALSTQDNCKVTLLYVNRSGSSTLFAAELTALAKRFEGRLHVVHYRTDERDPDLHSTRPVRRLDPIGEALAISHERYQRGQLDGTRFRALLQGRLHPAKVDDWFLCAPPRLVEMVRTTLADNEVPGEAVHIESFRAPGS
ncbi:fatty acid desaturase [Amycolatopsis sp. cg5]|uniref:fatty acid desaturase n=1 Tax=Amycolatopsis sp. cg5 TaxID=3238802 RepID=UPI0035231496